MHLDRDKELALDQIRVGVGFPCGLQGWSSAWSDHQLVQRGSLKDKDSQLDPPHPNSPFTTCLRHLKKAEITAKVWKKAFRMKETSTKNLKEPPDSHNNTPEPHKGITRSSCSLIAWLSVMRP